MRISAQAGWLWPVVWEDWRARAAKASLLGETGMAADRGATMCSSSGYGGQVSLAVIWPASGPLRFLHANRALMTGRLVSCVCRRHGHTEYVEWARCEAKRPPSLTPRMDSRASGAWNGHRQHGYATRMVLPKPGRQSGLLRQPKDSPCHAAISAGLSDQRISLTSMPTKGAALIQLRSAVKAGSPSRFASARQARSPSERPNGLV